MVHAPHCRRYSVGCEFMELLQSSHGLHGIPFRLGIFRQEKSVTSYLAIKERPLLTLVCHPSSPLAIPHSDPKLRKHLHRPCKLPLFCLFAPNFEVKIRMCIIHGYDNYIPWAYNNGHNNPMYNAHKNMGAHYTQQNTVSPRPILPWLRSELSPFNLIHVHFLQKHFFQE